MLSGGIFVHKMWFFRKAEGKFTPVFVDRTLTKEKDRPIFIRSCIKKTNIGRVKGI